jgi:hypothetical protein
MNYEKIQFEREIIDMVRSSYILRQINVKNSKVRVERSPIFKDRFFLNILGNSVKQDV